MNHLEQTIDLSVELHRNVRATKQELMSIDNAASCLGVSRDAILEAVERSSELALEGDVVYIPKDPAGTLVSLGVASVLFFAIVILPMFIEKM